MKITGGSYKGRSLFTPRPEIRPTQDSVREAIFNIIGGDSLRDILVLDLFCGSGAFGIEALSRGAGEVYFVDSKKPCLLAVKRNLDLLNGETGRRAFLIKADVFKIIKNFKKKALKFDLIFADPPYYKGLEKKCLQTLNEYDILSTAGLIVIEYFKKDNLDIELKNLILVNTRTYGDTKISLFKKKIRFRRYDKKSSFSGKL